LYEELKGKDKTEQKGYTGWLTPGRGDQRTWHRKSNKG